MSDSSVPTNPPHLEEENPQQQQREITNNEPPIDDDEDQSQRQQQQQQIDDDDDDDDDLIVRNDDFIEPHDHHYTAEDFDDDDDLSFEDEEEEEAEEEEEEEEHMDLAVTSPRVSVNLVEAAGEEGEIDGLICPICMGPWTNGGDHQLCCLPCGHLYGLSCISRWIGHRKGSAKCPQCNRKCKAKDIREIYGARVVVTDEESKAKIQFLEAKCALLEDQLTERYELGNKMSQHQVAEVRRICNQRYDELTREFNEMRCIEDQKYEERRRQFEQEQQQKFDQFTEFMQQKQAQFLQQQQAQFMQQQASSSSQP